MVSGYNPVNLRQLRFVIFYCTLPFSFLLNLLFLNLLKIIYRHLRHIYIVIGTIAQYTLPEHCLLLVKKKNVDLLPPLCDLICI